MDQDGSWKKGGREGMVGRKEGRREVEIEEGKEGRKERREEEGKQRQRDGGRGG